MCQYHFIAKFSLNLENLYYELDLAQVNVWALMVKCLLL